MLERARRGDAQAFCELSRLHGARLMRQAFTLCRDETLAEELAQETLVEAWRCLHRYGERCQFFTWLCAILLNRYRNAVRERPMSANIWGTSSGAHEENDQAAELVDPGLLPDEAASKQDQESVMRSCIDSLSPKHKEVIHMRFYVDDSLEGIAAALGCSVGTVKSRLFHAMEKLRGMKELRPQPRPSKPNENAQ